MDLSRLNASDRRRALLGGDSTPLVDQRLADLEDRISELEKPPSLLQIARYLIKRIERTEKKLKLPKYKPKNPLASLKRRTSK